MTQVELAAFQVSRRALPWLLAAVVASVLPHVAHLPYWLVAVVAACVGWRIAVHRGRVSYPSRRLQGLFAVLLLGGVALQYRTLAGHEAGTAALVAMFSLKLLEMYKERDAYVVILIGYFVAAMAFLFFFSVWMAFYVAGVAILFTAALVAINGTLDMPRREPLIKATVLVLQSVPIALLLFVVMPRIGPLWSIGLKPGESATGISDVMDYGDVGQLARSDELAFRVEFEDIMAMPPTSRLYWRGLTLSVFDGRRWLQDPGIERYPSLTHYYGTRVPDWRERLQAAVASRPDALRVRYAVVIEPTQRPWLFALAVPDAGQQRQVGLVHDQRLRLRTPVKTVTRYDVTSVLGVPRDLELSPWLREESVALPEAAGPRARAWALQQRAESADDADFIRRVLRHFGEEPFAYTLSPPPVPGDVIDGFLFSTRSGFCEHYASSFVFLLRAAGIPARVVAGYQGGEVNPLNGALQVRQYDAHAWAEAWLPGRGWVEFDPTAAVAPARIERGAREAIGDEPAFMADAALRDWWRPGSALEQMRDALDYLNHSWNMWVLGYDEASQRGLLKRWLGSYSPQRIGMLLLGIGVLVAGLLTLWMFRESLFSREEPVAREYRRFCAGWALRGHVRQPGEGPLDYASRLQRAEPSRASQVQRFMALYVALAYGGRTPDTARLRELRQARGEAV